MPNNTEAWVALITCGLLLLDRIRSYFSQNKKDKEQIRLAISTESQVKDQLDLGNTKEAVLILRGMITQQRDFYNEREAIRDKREEELETELAEAKKTIHTLELDVSKLQRKVRELETHG